MIKMSIKEGIWKSGKRVYTNYYRQQSCYNFRFNFNRKSEDGNVSLQQINADPIAIRHKWGIKDMCWNTSFNVNTEAKLPEEKAQLIHHLVAKLLYLCRCTRQDLHSFVPGCRHQIRMTKKTHKGKAILKWKLWSDTNNRARFTPKLLDRQFLCIIPRHEESYWEIHDTRQLR